MKKEWIRWLGDCSKHEVSMVGGKCASLGELNKAGKNVPPGFAITVHAYQDFVKMTGLDRKINQVLQAVVQNPNEPQSFAEANRIIAPIVQSTPIPVEIMQAIKEAYEELSRRSGTAEALVAVRSSATMEDSVESSFAGQHETYLNVCGLEDVWQNTLLCWASLFSAPALHYRTSRSMSHSEAEMAIAVQKMVNSRAAGVMFTVDPVSGDQSKVVIEGSWGLGEGVVSGHVTPDHYGMDKKTVVENERWISPKMTAFIRDPATGKTVESEVDPEKQNLPCLTQEELEYLTRLAISIEEYFGHPQDIEWAIDSDLPFPQNIMILQSRPVTVWGGVKAAIS